MEHKYIGFVGEKLIYNFGLYVSLEFELVFELSNKIGNPSGLHQVFESPQV